jgi:hypothetical protein
MAGEIGSVVTLRVATSITLTLPTGSSALSPEGVGRGFGVPSLATRTRRPSGVNVTMSGSEPTTTGAPSCCRVRVSKNTTMPGTVLSGTLSIAIAARPLWTATLLTAPKLATGMLAIRCPETRLSTSTPVAPATHSVSVPRS